jgi:hypothetical protein
MNKENIVAVIYQIQRLISVGEIYTNFCQAKLNKNDFKFGIQFAKENLYIILVSQLYTVFDENKKAVSLDKITFDNDELEKKRNSIINKWNQIKDPIKIIRNNIGFHSSIKINGQKKASEQFEKIGQKPLELINELKSLFADFTSQQKNG